MILFLRNLFRRINKNKSYYFLNFLGLTIGITCSLYVFFIVSFELSYDDFHSNKDRIYRINTVFNRAGNVEHLPASTYPIAHTLKEEFPEVERVAMVKYEEYSLIHILDNSTNNLFKEEDGVVITSSDFFEIFDVKWIYGNKEMLNQPNNIVISKSWAMKYFNSSNPSEIINKTIRYDNKYTFTVVGIVNDPPVNTDFPFHMYISQSTYDDEINYQKWAQLNFSTHHYLLIQANQSAENIKSQINGIVKDRAGERVAGMLVNKLQPLSEIHFDNQYGNFSNRSAPKSTLIALALIGLAILLTACINFVNLATAQATVRAKEIGIKKILGSSKKALLLQFLGETTFLTLLSIIFSVLLTYLFHSLLCDILGFTFILNYASGITWICLIVLACLVVLSAGLYPSIVLSRVSTSSTLQKSYQSNTGKSVLRKSLVISQFLIAQILIICAFTMMSQINYFLNKDLGYSQDAIIKVTLPNSKVSNSFKLIYDKLDIIPEVANYSASDNIVTVEKGSSKTYRFEGTGKESNHVTSMRYADINYIDTYDIKLIAGRIYKKSDTLNEVVINEKMAQSMGFTQASEALNRSIFIGKKKVKISGVIRNVNFSSLRKDIGPLTIATSKKKYEIINIKLNSLASGVKKIRQAWREVYPDIFFDFTFVDEATASLYNNEIRTSKIFNTFALIALFISALGLYGIVSFMVNQKTKEVGIRKVLGASIPHIMYLFSFEFIKLVLIAFAIAAPIGYYLMNEWLNEFNFRIDVEIGIFISALLTSTAIALITMSYRSYQAASSNPVNSLRSE